MCAQSYSFVGIWCKETAETARGDELPQKWWPKSLPWSPKREVGNSVILLFKWMPDGAQSPSQRKKHGSPRKIGETHIQNICSRSPVTLFLCFHSSGNPCESVTFLSGLKPPVSWRKHTKWIKGEISPGKITWRPYIEVELNKHTN